MTPTFAATRAVLLRRHGLVFLDPGAPGPRASERELQAAALELAQVGYAASWRLQAAFARLPSVELGILVLLLAESLALHAGGGRQHTPLFRNFPEDVPKDTFDLYLRKVLCHYFQAEGQPCLYCRRVGTTHVLDPCHHVVCDHCFDGANYSACPVCEHHVDRRSPFFKPSRLTSFRLPKERVTFKLLDLGDDLLGAARELLLSFCARKQAMSPSDVDDLVLLVRDLGPRVLAWLPPKIAVRENIAHIFGALLRAGDPLAAFAAARPHLTTATDVLRLLAAYSGHDPALPPQRVWHKLAQPAPGAPEGRWIGKLAPFQGDKPPASIHVSILSPRFKLARLGRPLRRAIAQHLESLDPASLTEDLMRHRAVWVGVGERLHPHEFAARCPALARAFALARGRAPDGAPAPRFVGFHAAVENAARAGDAAAMSAALRPRPGELGRRLDFALRVAGADVRARAQVLADFAAAAPRLSTPLLLSLQAALPTRDRALPVRIFWPKGQVSKATSTPDRRATLDPRAIAEARATVEAELLRRFADKPRFERAVIDEALRGVVVPFNERTASKAAVALPRGSQIGLPPGKVARLFLHWCEPERGGRTTDIDLSVGFYDAAWRHVGVCSFYQLRLDAPDGRPIARSSGDLRSAPFPDGASEFVDLHREHARAHGYRYAVMVVNNYAGLPFDRLERGMAGLMLREDLGGAHFDPRTVALRFDLQGDNGVYLPLLLDIEAGRIHWLDVYSKGAFAMNSVASSNAAITTVCPNMLAYFGAGARPAMFELALLHAAARCREIVLRGDAVRVWTRSPGETPASFLARVRSGEGALSGLPPGPAGPPTLAALFRGDLDLPAGSACYALFRERVVAPLAASDLLS